MFESGNAKKYQLNSFFTDSVPFRAKFSVNWKLYLNRLRYIPVVKANYAGIKVLQIQ